jgi:hypothetical protein
MQILEIWNNLFTKDLEIHSNFLSSMFLIFFNVQKNENQMPFPLNLKFTYANI